MILANVNIGTGPSAGDGDPLRSAFARINNNFQIITNNVNALTNSVTTVAGRTGDVVLTVNDVIGAASVAYVNSVASGNVNVTVASDRLTNGIHTFLLQSDGTISLDGIPFSGGESYRIINGYSQVTVPVSNGPVLIGVNDGYEWRFETNGTFQLPTGVNGMIYSPGNGGIDIKSDEYAELYYENQNVGDTPPNYNAEGYIWTTYDGAHIQNYRGGAFDHHWIFGTDGNIHLPTGGTIVDHSGNDLLVSTTTNIETIIDASNAVPGQTNTEQILRLDAVGYTFNSGTEGQTFKILPKAGINVASVYVIAPLGTIEAGVATTYTAGAKAWYPFSDGVSIKTMIYSEGYWWVSGGTIS